MQILATIEYDRGNQIGVGQGMNSKVFLARDPQLGGEIAVKEIEKATFVNGVTSYFEEAQAMFATTHPNIVPIQYACETPTHIVLAMPYFANGSLALRILSAPLTIREFIRVSQGVLNGVTQIHKASFIHFDLKPSNVLFNNVDAPLVADFGQTRRILPNGVMTVPPMYPTAIPPETWASGVGSFLSDIYQAGLLFYRAVNGDFLYNAQFSGISGAALKAGVVAGRLPNRKVFLPHVPQRVRSIIRKAMRPNPSERYQSAAELATAIGRVQVGLDWITAVKLNGEITWRANRLDKPDLEVSLISSGANWDVQVWTVNGVSRRAKGLSDYWADGLSYTDAIKQLNDVFEGLG